MESQAKQHATDQQIQGKEQKGTHGDTVSNFLASPARASWDLWPAGTEQGISYLSSHPPPSFIWIPLIPLPQRGRERALCVPGTQLFPPPHTLWNLIQKSHAIKMSLFAIIFNAIPNSKIFHSLFSFQEEWNNKVVHLKEIEWGRGRFEWTRSRKAVVVTALKAVSAVHGFLHVTRSNPARHIHRFSLTASQWHLRQARFWLKNVCKMAAYWSLWSLTLYIHLAVLQHMFLLLLGKKTWGKRIVKIE